MAKASLAPAVAVLNMKGGVGKTTISANIFRLLFRTFKASTLLLDLDPQYNLTQTLFRRDDCEKLRAEGKTIYAAMEPSSSTGGLFEVATTASPPPSPDSVAKVLRHFGDSQVQLSIVPGDFRLVKYSLMSQSRKLEAVQERFLAFVKMARERFKVVCIDCNPSSSFFTLCALHACSHLLVPVRPDRYSILGLEMLADFVDSIPTIYPKPPIIVVLNGVPRTGYDRAIEDELRSHPVFGASTLANPVYHSGILTAKHDYTGFATDKPVPWQTLLTDELTRVVDEVATHLGIER